MKFSKLTAAALLAMTSLPVVAHAESTQVAAGAMVYGPQGAEVGKIEQIAGENVVVDTGTHKATLPASVFADGENGPVIGFTKEQLDAAIEAANQQAAAKVDAAIVPGAPVRSSDGVALGAIKSVGADGMIVIDHTSGPISLSREQFATDASGLIVRISAQQIENALSQQTAASDEVTPDSEPEA